MLKAELHSHVKGDKEDKQIKYSVYDLIDEAAKKRFDVLAITCHDTMFYDAKAREYAKNKGMLLIFGIEKTIEGRHVLVYNAKKGILKIKTIGGLAEYKKKNNAILVIAPHPFNVFSFCLKEDILRYPHLFDAWEHSFFYTHLFNPNKKLLKLAKKLKKPVVGNSDIHYINDLGLTYTLIDSEKNENAVFDAIKKGKAKVETKPLSLFNFCFRFLRFLFNIFIKKQ